jgi:hypothetical protein
MKLRPEIRKRKAESKLCRAGHSALRTPRSAFTLVECLVYIGVLAMVFMLAINAFWKCMEYSRDLRRNADDVARALKAGERWREDIRAAQSVETINEANGVSLQLATAQGPVRYTFNDGNVWREDGGPAGKLVFLAGVKASGMKLEKRTLVSGWTWELELETRRALAKVRPMFTFVAVQDTEVEP